MVYFESAISGTTDSEQSMKQVSKWFNTCRESHAQCKDALAGSSFLPSRLIEITGESEEALAIHLTSKEHLSKATSYATLSHRWGDFMPFKLEQERLEACFDSIPTSDISQVFLDAIKVAWRLGISFIWIDSLCKRASCCILWHLLIPGRYHPRLVVGLGHRVRADGTYLPAWHRKHCCHRLSRRTTRFVHGSGHRTSDTDLCGSRAQISTR